MKKITKRDILVFFLGFITFFVIETVYDWEGAKKSFRKGWNSVDVENGR